MLFKPVIFSDALDRLQPHDHICLIYETIEELVSVVIPFISNGLKKNEKCIYIKSSSSSDQIHKLIEKKRWGIPEDKMSNLLMILQKIENLEKNNFFDWDWITAYLVGETKKAISEGYSALRVTCEMYSYESSPHIFDSFIELEEKFNKEFFPKYPCLCLCQYDRKKIPPEVIKRITMAHPLLIQRHRVSLNILYTLFCP